MRVEQSGTISHIGETESFASGFCKRLVVIEYQSGNYTNHLAAYVMKDRCALLDDMKIGDVAALVCDVKSREYNGKWYTDVNCFAIDAETPAPMQKAGPAPVADAANNDDLMDDDPMPF